MAEERKIALKVEVDASGVKSGFDEVGRQADAAAARVTKAGQDAGKGIAAIGQGGAEAAGKVDATTRSIIGSIQRTTAAHQAGEKGTARYYEAIAGARGVNTDILRPYLDQLRLAESAQRAAAASTVPLSSGLKDVHQSAVGAAMELGQLVRLGVAGFFGGQIVQSASAAAKAMFQASAEAERLRTMLNFASGGNGAREVEYLRAVTQRLGLEFGTTAKAYGQFQAAAKGTALEGDKARAVFESVAKASAVMGLSASDTSGVLLALQQMVSKGTVQAEELRGQLGERLPGAFQIAAKAMGVTTAELGKMLEQGQVVADDFLPKFGKALEENIGGAAEKAANRLDASVNRFNDAWERLKQTAGESGISKAMGSETDAITRDLGAVIDAMENTRKAGGGMFAELAAGAGVGLGRTVFSTLNLAANALNGTINALTGSAFGLRTDLALLPDILKTNAQQSADLASDLKRAEGEFARLKAAGADTTKNIYIQSSYFQLQEYIKGLRAAQAEQAKLVGGVAPSPNMNAGVTASGQAREQYEARRAKEVATAEAGLLDVRMRASGVNKSYLEDLKKWQAGLDAGSVSQKAYIEGVSALATATYKSSAAGKDAAASAKGSGAAASSAASAYASLISSINQKIEAERLELSGGDKLTASQRERIKLDADLAAGRVKLTAAQISSVRAGLDMLEVAEKQNSATREAMKVAMAAAAARSKEADSIKAWFDAQESAAAQALKSATDRITSLQGEEEAARLAAAMNISLASAIEHTALARLREKQAGFRANSDGYNALQKEIEAREKILELVEQKGAREAQAASNQAMVQEWENTVKQYDDIFQKGFADLVNGGENAWKSFTKSLTTTFKTTVADQIYKMFLRPFVVNVVGNLLGVSGAGGAMQAVTGGGGGGLMGMASNAYSAYGLYNGGIGGTAIGQAYAGYTGATLPAGMMGPSATPISMWSQAGNYAGSIGSGSAGVGAGGTAAGGSMAGFMGYAAVVALIANAMGAFRSDKSVGGGLTGTLGKGDISGYELWREGGTLFDGPNFATKNPSELIARYESQLEALRGSGEGSSQPAFKLQTEITQLQREYGAQIEATRKQSGALQLAYDGMRANVGNMADALGLGSAKVRDWTMAFGTDAVHPDLGGTAVIFDGLKDEEIAVKIQEALASANNTLAEMVLGEWVTTTEVIKRTLESTAPIYGDMEIPGEWDEITESITKTTYVASKYAKEGEKAIDTLTRLAVSLGSVNQVFDALGVSAYEASLAGGDLASKLIDMLGGGEAFAAITGSYYENYYSEAERMGKATEALAAELAKAGVAMPTTKDAYRAIVTEALEAGEAGQALAAKLLGLSSAFAQVADYAEQAAEAMSERSRQEIENLKQLARTQAGLWADLAEAQGDMATAELRRYWIETEGMTLAEQAAYDYNAAIKVQISAAKEAAAAAKKLADAERSLIAERASAAQQAYSAAKSATDAARAALERSVDVERDIYNSARDAAQEAANEVRSVIDALASNIKDLYREVNSTLRMGATAGLDFVANALQNARLTGYLPDAKDLAEAIAGARAGMGAENYASQFESDRERLILAGQLSDLAGYAEPQLTAAEKAVKQAEAQLKSLDGILKTAKDQLDASRGIDTSVKTIPEALASLQAAIVGELKAQTAAFLSGIVASLSGGKLTPQEAVKQYEGKAGEVIPREKWVDLAGTNAYLSTGGAAALGGEKNVRDAAIHSKTGEQTTVGAAVDFVAEAIKTGDLYSIYAAAVRHGISSVSLDTMMGWPGGTSLDWAKQNNLPAFAVGTNYVPRDMVAQIHEGEAIVPKAFNPWAGGQGGSGGAEVVTELRALREENRQQAGEIARLNLRMARVLERWDGDGAPPKREEATV